MPEQPRGDSDAILRALDPGDALKVSAIGMHEMFVSFLSGGFTEDQALRLVAYCVIEKDSQ